MGTMEAELAPAPFARPSFAWRQPYRSRLSDLKVTFLLLPYLTLHTYHQSTALYSIVLTPALRGLPLELTHCRINPLASSRERACSKTWTTLLATQTVTTPATGETG